MSKELIDPLAAVRVLQAIIDARQGLSRLLLKAQHNNKGEPATESVGHVAALHFYIRTVDGAIWGDGETGGVIIRELNRGSDEGNP